MGVRVWYSKSTIRGAYRGLIGPDKDGNIKLPDNKSNLFLRRGTCGSAPLYHQERWSRFKFIGEVKVECFFDYRSSQILEISRGTWSMSARLEPGYPRSCWYYYSQNGKRFTCHVWCSNNDKSKFDSIFDNEKLSIEERVKQCWALCHTNPTVKEGWDGLWDYYIPVDVEVVPVHGSLSKRYFNFWECATETGLVMPDHDLSIALSKASEDLAASLPQTPINIAESLLDLVSANNISKAFGASEKVSAMLADSWLKWRYVYTTTKLDVRSMREFIQRGLSLFDGVTGKDFSCYGYAHMGDLTCRCSTTLQCKNVKEQFRRASQSLHTYDLWDIVPWSFVVDWFIPIGSMLQNLEFEGNLLKLDHGTIWYTCEWYEDSDSENFMRFCTDSFVTTPCSIFYNKGATNKTISMRCIDAMALLVGR